MKTEPIALTDPYVNPSCTPCAVPPDKVTPEMKQKRIELNKQRAMTRLIATINLGPAPSEIIATEMKNSSLNFKLNKEKVEVLPEFRPARN